MLIELAANERAVHGDFFNSTFSIFLTEYLLQNKCLKN